jgi:hypothetical protein
MTSIGALVEDENYAQGWIRANADQLAGWIDMARIMDGGVHAFVVMCWHAGSRELDWMSGDNPEKVRWLMPPPSGQPRIGYGVSFPPGVCTMLHRERAIGLLARRGFRAQVDDLARQKRDDRRISVVAFVGDRATIYRVLIPGASEGDSTVVQG